MIRGHRARQLVLMLALLLVVARASARSQSEFEKHTTAAQTLYAEKNYNGALDQFTAAYQLDPEPWLLINIGRCHYLADRPKEALGFYNKALQAKLSRSEREEVMASVAKATIKLQEQQQREATENAARQAVVQERLAQLSVPQKPLTPLYKRPLLWGLIGGTAAVGLALGLGLGLGLRQQQPAPTFPSGTDNIF